MSASDSPWQWAKDDFLSRGYTVREIETEFGRALYPGQMQDGLVVAPLGLLPRGKSWAVLRTPPCGPVEIEEFGSVELACEAMRRRLSEEFR